MPGRIVAICAYSSTPRTSSRSASRTTTLPSSARSTAAAPPSSTPKAGPRELPSCSPRCVLPRPTEGGHLLSLCRLAPLPAQPFPRRVAKLNRGVGQLARSCQLSINRGFPGFRRPRIRISPRILIRDFARKTLRRYRHWLTAAGELTVPSKSRGQVLPASGLDHCGAFFSGYDPPQAKTAAISASPQWRSSDAQAPLRKSFVHC